MTSRRSAPCRQTPLNHHVVLRQQPHPARNTRRNATWWPGHVYDQAANQAGQSIVSRDLGVQPTLTVRPGFPLDVMVNRDIVLLPYGGG
jgi:type IV secretory pathway VirB10-like protein